VVHDSEPLVAAPWRGLGLEQKVMSSLRAYAAGARWESLPSQASGAKQHAAHSYLASHRHTVPPPASTRPPAASVTAPLSWEPLEPFSFPAWSTAAGCGGQGGVDAAREPAEGGDG
jgi:hypothetical protein